MITTKALHKRYGDKVAVDDLSLDVRPGMMTGFLGPNGAGNVLEAKAFHPTRGYVTRNDPRATSHEPRATRSSESS